MNNDYRRTVQEMLMSSVVEKDRWGVRGEEGSTAVCVALVGYQ